MASMDAMQDITYSQKNKKKQHIIPHVSDSVRTQKTTYLLFPVRGFVHNAPYIYHKKAKHGRIF